MPALAAPCHQGGGDVHFGRYELEEDDIDYGDQVVFGEVEIEEGARLDGDLVVLGDADIAGEVNGSIFCAGVVRLRDTAYIRGDLSSTSRVDRSEGAVVEGEVTYMEDFPEEFEWPFPGISPVKVEAPMIRTRPWMRALGRMVRGVASLIIMGLLSIVIVSIWPEQTERVGQTIMESPITAFGMGILTFLVAGIGLAILTILICTIPFAMIGAVLVGVGVALGWVAMGMMLGQRVMEGLFRQSQTQLVAALVGTMILTSVAAMANVVWSFLYVVLMMLLCSPAIGAVVLTRFGSVAYGSPGQAPPAPPHPPVPPAPPEPTAEASAEEEAPPADSEVEASPSELR
jgi:hypothetical protein